MAKEILHWTCTHFLEMQYEYCVAVTNDFDSDGDLDLFVGGEAYRSNYGCIPKVILPK